MMFDKLQILPYDREELKKFSYNGVEKEYTGNVVLPIIDYYATQGECFYGVIDYKIIGVAGIYPLWSGAGGCYLFLNKEAESYKKSIFKAIITYMNTLVKKYQIKTLIVECIGDSIKAGNLIDHLGFSKNKEVKMALYTKKVGI